MTVPNSQQLAEAHATGRLPIVGRIRWALRTAAADCRSPDGAPITAICVSLISWACMVCRYCRCWRGGSGVAAPAPDERTQRNLVFAMAASYLALFGLVLWQAFRGSRLHNRIVCRGELCRLGWCLQRLP